MSGRQSLPLGEGVTEELRELVALDLEVYVDQTVDELRVCSGNVGNDLARKYLIRAVAVVYGSLEELAVADPLLVYTRAVLVAVVEAGLVGASAEAVCEYAVRAHVAHLLQLREYLISPALGARAADRELVVTVGRAELAAAGIYERGADLIAVDVDDLDLVAEFFIVGVVRIEEVAVALENDVTAHVLYLLDVVAKLFERSRIGLLVSRIVAVHALLPPCEEEDGVNAALCALLVDLRQVGRLVVVLPHYPSMNLRADFATALI